MFSLTVDDRSDEHNFHLFGPGGVDVTTGVAAVGVKTFSVTFVDGDVHLHLRSPPGPDEGHVHRGQCRRRRPLRRLLPRQPRPTKLVLTVTSQAVTLKTPAGKAVKALKKGRAAITVRDRSATRGVKLSGAGVSKTTGVDVRRHDDLERQAVKGTLVYAAGTRGAPGRPRAGFVIRV